MVADGGVLGDFFAADGTSLVAGAAAVIAANGSPLLPRVRNAAEAGAAAVLVYGSILPAGAAGLSEDAPIPVLAVPSGTGRAIAAAGGEGAEVTIGRSGPVANPELAQIAGFSSRGPGYGAAKPDLVAPGVALATPDAGPDPDAGRYAAVSGTSAAAAVVRAAPRSSGRHGLSSTRPLCVRSWWACAAARLVLGAAGYLRGRRPRRSGRGGGGSAGGRTGGAVLRHASEPGLLADRMIEVKNLSSRPLDVTLGLATDLGAGAKLSLAPTRQARPSRGVGGVPAPGLDRRGAGARDDLRNGRRSGGGSGCSPRSLDDHLPGFGNGAALGRDARPRRVRPVGEAPGGACVPGRCGVRGGGRRRDRSGRVPRRRAGNPEGEGARHDRPVAQRTPRSVRDRAHRTGPRRRRTQARPVRADAAGLGRGRGRG